MPFGTARGGLPQLGGVHAGLIPDAEGHPQAATVQGLRHPGGHPGALLPVGGGIAVGAAGLLPEVLVPGQHGHVHRDAVPGGDVQIIRGVVLVLPTVAAHRCGDAHVEHAGVNGRLVVCLDLPGGVHRVLVHVDIDESRAHDPATGVDDLVGGAGGKGDFSVLQPEIPLFVYSVFRVDQRSVPDQQLHFPASWPDGSPHPVIGSILLEIICVFNARNAFSSANNALVPVRRAKPGPGRQPGAR